MTCNITNTPMYPEPLPLYQRERPSDSISIHSAAPSYVSDTPTYASQCPTSHSNSFVAIPSTPQRGSGLPATPQYAPGYHARSQSSLDVSTYGNVSSWSSTRSSVQGRQYHAVARRRASQAANATAILNSLSAVPPPTNTSSPSSSQTNLGSALTRSTSYPVTTGPVSPLEDPYLVGEAAANKARQQRIYREMCIRGEETARYESRSWEFMFGQMADWDERQRSWSKFRDQVGHTKLLGRRLGVRT
ncbi:hypothetical protein GQ43DRAFT_472926 [Delitschia confertaspora ATCC 74209]|uniref:Uncharacterized protein n=1 Tax=Delitschia confertaspora ATCC 74209 TaxID=1513339 RepID=A0A9P4JIT2_9PLEO|nr:hypothetical protein GQ43DRAFT_472926 [Delitschia confertaspora ATCC 74209]